MIRWTKQNQDLLESMYTANKPDEEIARAFGTYDKYAIAKQRSKQGLVSSKRCKHTRKEKSVRMPLAVNFVVIHYTYDGQDHFYKTDGDPSNQARILLMKKGINEVLILKPMSKMIMQGITEVKLT